MNRRSLLAMLFGAAAVPPVAAAGRSYMVGKTGPELLGPFQIVTRDEYGGALVINEVFFPAPLGKMKTSKPLMSPKYTELSEGVVEVEPRDGYRRYERLSDIIARETKRVWG